MRIAQSARMLTTAAEKMPRDHDGVIARTEKL
jgi:hypothetical protein